KRVLATRRALDPRRAGVTPAAMGPAPGATAAHGLLRAAAEERGEVGRQGEGRGPEGRRDIGDGRGEKPADIERLAESHSNLLGYDRQEGDDQRRNGCDGEAGEREGDEVEAGAGLGRRVEKDRLGLLGP